MKYVGDTALPPAFEGAGEKTFFENRNLSLHCFNTVHYHCFKGFTQKGADIHNLW